MNTSNVQGRALETEAPPNVNSILRLPKVLAARAGISPSGHYSDCAEGLFTKPIKIGRRASGWPATEVAAINAARIAGKNDDEVRALVRKLMAARATLAG